MSTNIHGLMDLVEGRCGDSCYINSIFNIRQCSQPEFDDSEDSKVGERQ
jgi:hypothetical protein